MVFARHGGQTRPPSEQTFLLMLIRQYHFFLINLQSRKYQDVLPEPSTWFQICHNVCLLSAWHYELGHECKPTRNFLDTLSFYVLGPNGLLESKSLTCMNDGPGSIILGRNLCLHDITNLPGAIFSSTPCTALRVAGLVVKQN